LVHQNKHTLVLWLATTPEMETAALRELFEYLDDYDTYCDLRGSGGPGERLYLAAKAGDDVALRTLLTSRAGRNFEYEAWWFQIVHTPRGFANA
jgi:hypothetical protein